jgi:hypothetical protein
MNQVAANTVGLIRRFIALSILLTVVLIFAVYWYLNPRIVDFFANPTESNSSLVSEKTTDER